MFKNVTNQKLMVFAYDSTTGVQKTGDAANITAYVSKDYGSVNVLGDTSATEMDATNAKGYYLFDLTQAETNADTLLFSAKSSTANIIVIGAPAAVFTTPANFTTQAIDSSGRVDLGKWLGGTIPAPNVTGVPLVDDKYLLGTVYSTPATAGIQDINVKNMNNVAATAITTIKAVQGLTTADTIATYTGNTVQTGDSYARIGAAGAGLTALGDTRIAHLDADVSSRMATYSQPTGFLAATFPSGTIANTTNITAGTITTTTNLTNAATSGDLTATMKTSVTTAATAATPTAAAVTGAVGSVTGAVGSVTGNVGGNVTGSVGSVTGLIASNLDAAISSRLASASYTAPSNASIAAIKAKTDSLTFTISNQVDSNIQSVNDTTVIGDGQTGTEWGS